MMSSLDDYKFVAKLGNLKTLVQLLRSINFKEWATCCCSDNGVKITVEDSKCIQGIAYIPKIIFQEYNLTEDVIFKINLTVLVECLGMFWGSISTQGVSVMLQLMYKDVGHPVSVLIEEDGILTDCSLKTLEPDDLIDFNIDPSNVLNKVILNTEILRDIWSELDPTTDVIALLLSPDTPYFRISTSGIAGECHIEIPHDTDSIENFQCRVEATFCYQYSSMKPAMKALTCANKVSLKTDNRGLLVFQFMVKTDDGHLSYIEYYHYGTHNDGIICYISNYDNIKLGYTGH